MRWGGRWSRWWFGITRCRGAGLTEEEIRKATFILWKGHCSVHQLFRPEHVDQARAKYPGGEGNCASGVPV